MKGSNYENGLGPWIDPAHEARVVAWVLGEASDFEVAELERLVAENPELGLFKRRIEAVHGLVGEAVCPDAEPWSLAPERREALAAALGEEPAPAKVVRSGRGAGTRVLMMMAACALGSLVMVKLIGQREPLSRQLSLPATGGDQPAAPGVEIAQERGPAAEVAPLMKARNLAPMADAAEPPGEAAAAAPAMGTVPEAAMAAEEAGDDGEGDTAAEGLATFSLPAAGGVRGGAPVVRPAGGISQNTWSSEGAPLVGAQLSEPALEGGRSVPRTLGGEKGAGPAMEDAPVQGFVAAAAAEDGPAGADRSRGLRAEVAPRMKGAPAGRAEIASTNALPSGGLFEDHSAAQQPLSSFTVRGAAGELRERAARVMRASRLGERVPGVLRVEQFYNGFDYGDPAPASGEVAIRVEQSAHPYLPGRSLMRIAVKAAVRGAGPAEGTIGVQVRFNPERVGRYRLVGYEPQPAARERVPATTDKLNQELAADGAAAGVAVYEVEVLAGGAGDLGTVAASYGNPGTGAVVERSQPLPFLPAPPAFAQAPAPLQLAATAAAVAETLAGGPQAARVRLSALTPAVDGLRRSYPNDPQVAALVDLLATLAR